MKSKKEIEKALAEAQFFLENTEDLDNPIYHIVAMKKELLQWVLSDDEDEGMSFGEAFIIVYEMALGVTRNHRRKETLALEKIFPFIEHLRHIEESGSEL